MLLNCNFIHVVKGASGDDDDVALCLVAKQIIIHKLPKVLILHIKRFIIGEYMVKKDTTYVSFPYILDVAPYCSNTCLQVEKLEF